MEKEHPLLHKDIRKIGSWQEWLKLWNETSTFELLHSLLHFGFDVHVNREERVDHIVFYLSIANGWLYGRAFAESLTGNWHRIPLARKAFEVLCLRFFKDGPVFDHVGTDEENGRLIKEILSFFYDTDEHRNNGRGLKNIPANESDDHHSEIARDFLVEMIEWAWTYKSGDYRELTLMFAQLRPAFVEILAGLGRLDLLREGNKCPPDEACLSKLEEIALSREYYFHTEGKLRRPLTLDEAVYAGSYASRMLLELRAHAREEQRLNDIRELEREKRDAEAKLKKLQSA